MQGNLIVFYFKLSESPSEVGALFIVQNAKSEKSKVLV